MSIHRTRQTAVWFIAQYFVTKRVWEDALHIDTIAINDSDIIYGNLFCFMYLVPIKKHFLFLLSCYNDKIIIK